MPTGKEPVDHIERPHLPWRDDPGLTECGLAATSVRTMTRRDYARRLKEWGQQRTAITTCMTCLRTASRWTDWDEDPRTALGREVEWETAWHRGDRGARLRDELKAVAALIKAHPDEFRALVNQVAGTVDFLDERRKRGR